MPDAKAPRVPPLWAAALIGAAVGLLTYVLTEWNSSNEAIPAALQGGLLAAVWTLGLGAVFLELWGTQQRWLGLGALAALAGLIAATSGGVGSESVALMTLLVMLSGAGLLQAWQGGRQWDGRRALALLTDAPTLFALAALLALLFYGLLQLAGALAAAVGLDGVGEWLNKSIIAMPLILGAAAFFVAALRSRGWGQGLTRTLSAVMGYLLPVAALITVLFVVLLPIAAVRDLAALYDGFLSSYLYLSLAAVSVFLILHAFRDETQPTLTPALATFARWAAYLLPLFCLLALYGLSVRVGEYGLTEARVLGLSVAFWGLLLTLGLALTRREPPFAGLSRVLPPVLLGLLALALVLSVPGLRPADIATRSQLAQLQRADVTREQVRSTLGFLLDRQVAGQTALDGLDRAALAPTAAAELDRMDKLGVDRYRQLTLGYGGSLNDVDTAESGVTLDFAAKSAELSPARAAALTQVLEDWTKDPQTHDEVIIFNLCQDYPQKCRIKVYALPLEDGSLRVLALGHQGLNTGLWYDFPAGSDRISRRGYFGNVPLQQEWKPGPAWRGPVAVKRIQLEVLEVGGQQLPFVEENTGAAGK
ncbi:MAG: DUF4153 domain-containing protein [Deinococcus sp.]|nr:DUF4153 domain-containing protein [Deinococcus sp.]